MNYILMNDFSLKQYNTLKIESIAKNMIFPFNGSGIKEVYEEFSKEKEIVIIGKGSNILLSQEYYDESYIFMNLKLMDTLDYSDNQIFAEAGCTLSSISWFALENNIKGLEFIEDIPGSLGGAIIMNAGTYEDTIGQLVKEITYYDINANEIKTVQTMSDNFGRRDSIWSNNNYIIISCSLVGMHGDYELSLEKMLEIKKKRYTKQPRNYPNAGSVFKRPSLNGKDYFVWKLFDETGLRGMKRNDAMISDKHPGFIVNLGKAKYDDIKFLIDLAIKRVKDNYDIDLQLEWKII